MTERNTRPARHITQLERRLSEVLGREAWRASGLGAPGDIDALQQKLTQLEQQFADLKDRPTERDEDLEAARATHREPMTQLNSGSRHNAHLGKNDSRAADGRE
ncbi:hypothetical protein [Streptomyces monashensis]|uniref:Uncharacterized protein n=1 Tax=Streptomyces monashensis TaxID=1678012 RepID=A0A1S2Q5K7_9ACTN|nr:hypothetical protein [Streptomyces monashensis]OIK01033.1 hypothetical protein BIV23_26825 [Streptomyces monashensis]